MPGLLGPQQPQQGLLGQSVMDPNYQPPSQMRGLLGGAVRGVMDVLPLGDAMGGIRTNPFIKMVAQKLGIPLETASELVDKHMKPQGSQFDPNYRTANAAYDFGRAAVNAAPGAAYQMANAAPTKSTPQFTINQDGQIVWHGSPHKFDRFDASKIGTGEGAQAYGHGLYLAESPGVAASYQEKLSKIKDPYAMVDDAVFADSRTHALGQSAGFGAYDLKQTIAELAKSGKFPEGEFSGADALPLLSEAARVRRQQLAAQKGTAALQAKADLDALMKVAETNPAFVKISTIKDRGNLYKVDLPDSAIAKMLDWDKPLSQQPKAVQSALEGFAKPGMTGREIYESWAAESVAKRGAGADHNAYAASMAKQFDLPGIRYLDGGSRGAGAGTSNFVVFPGNESLLQILERNGVPLK